jgi:hypothetical protein
MFALKLESGATCSAGLASNVAWRGALKSERFERQYRQTARLRAATRRNPQSRRHSPRWLLDTHVEPGPASDHAAKQPATPQPAPERDEFDAMRAAMADLERLERYRRRAFSRERRAIRRFYDVQSTCKRGD